MLSYVPWELHVGECQLRGDAPSVPRPNNRSHQVPLSQVEMLTATLKCWRLK